MKPSHLLDLTNPNCELRDRLQCVILLCSVYCAVVLIYYSGVLNVLNVFIDIQTSKELVQMDTDKMMTYGTFTMDDDKLTQS